MRPVSHSRLETETLSESVIPFLGHGQFGSRCDLSGVATASLPSGLLEPSADWSSILGPHRWHPRDIQNTLQHDVSKV